MTIKEKVLSLDLPEDKLIEVIFLLLEVNTMLAVVDFKPSDGKECLVSLLAILEMEHSHPPIPKNEIEIRVFKDIFDL